MKEGATTHDYVEVYEIFPSRKLIGTLRLAFVPERLSESRHNSRVHHQWQKPPFREMSRRQRSKDFHQVCSLAQTLYNAPTNPSSGIPARKPFLAQSANQHAVRTEEH
jgi:hypothetical protein